MSAPVSKPFFKGTRNKVIAAFLLAFTGIALALGISYFSFHELMSTVDELSEPNKKLRTLNELFRKITTLDQEQRIELAKSYKTPSAHLLSSNRDLFLILDTLKTMDWEDEEQLNRIYEMQRIMTERDQLFINFLSVKYQNSGNRAFSLRLDSLSDALSNYMALLDTTIITEQNQRTVISYIPLERLPDKDDRSFFRKLFNKKKKDQPEPLIKVQEEVSIVADTIPLTREDSALYHASQLLKNLNTEQRSRDREMIQRELRFININTALLNELLITLHEVEAEEVNLMRSNNTSAVRLINFSIERIIIFLIVFFLLAASLLFFILTDISKSNYYREQLIAAKNEAEQLGQVKQRFLSNMSHEIRTPLQSIIGYSEQLKTGQGISEEAVEAIQSSSDHLLHIVNEVLDYSRIESGKLTFQNKPFRLVETIDQVVSAIKIQADKKGLTLHREVAIDDELEVSGDAFRLQQILFNLLSNAVKFTHEGFVRLSAEAKELDHSVRCTITVIDSGIGMDAETISRVFNQFEQADATTSSVYGGTGLGLTIAKSLLDAQHGSLDVNSTPGEGSVFTVTLSFNKPSLQYITPATSTSTKKIVLPQKIWVVDDDPLILKLCSRMLEKQSITHETIQQPKSIVDKPIENELSHVFLDIRMPSISGLELCGLLREKYGDRVMIIALTAHALPEEQARLLRAGFDSVLQKPFRESDFLTCLGLKPEEEEVSENDIDFTVLNKMTFHDKALQSSVMNQFVEETDTDLNFLEQLSEPVDTAALREVLHKLTGRVGQLGGIALSARFKEAEKELVNAGFHPPLRERVVQLVADLKSFQALIRDKALELS